MSIEGGTEEFWQGYRYRDDDVERLVARSKKAEDEAKRLREFVETLAKLKPLGHDLFHVDTLQITGVQVQAAYVLNPTSVVKSINVVEERRMTMQPRRSAYPLNTDGWWTRHDRSDFDTDGPAKIRTMNPDPRGSHKPCIARRYV